MNQLAKGMTIEATNNSDMEEALKKIQESVQVIRSVSKTWLTDKDKHFQINDGVDRIESAIKSFTQN